MTQYECVVVGGGLMGATVALGLAQQGRTVALLEAQEPAPFVPNTPPGLRVSALNYAAVALLERLGAWPAIAALRCAPYCQLAVWEHGAAAPIDFTADRLQPPILGYLVENQVLQQGIWLCLARYETLKIYTPVMLQQLVAVEGGWQLTLSSGHTLTTSLVIGADGWQSRVRQQAGIGVGGWQYRQQCLLMTVQTELPQQVITWQCFYPSGPRAFLPLAGHWASLAWYDTPEKILYLRGLPLAQLTAAIQRAYPERLGGVTATAAQAFPLVRQHAARYYLPGLALVGDAAHTIHPLAGQGANLGFRDVSALLNLLAPLRSLNRETGVAAALQRYQQQRLGDNRLMQNAMELIYQSFDSQRAPLPWLRQLALSSVERCPALKNKLLDYALGRLLGNGCVNPKQAVLLSSFGVQTKLSD